MTGVGSRRQNGKISTFLVESPRRNETFDRFLQLVKGFYTPNYLHDCFTFHMIRFTGYGVIAEKSRVNHLTLIIPCIL